MHSIFFHSLLFLKKIICLFLTALALCCRMGFSGSCGEQGKWGQLGLMSFINQQDNLGSFT